MDFFAFGLKEMFDVVTFGRINSKDARLCVAYGKQLVLANEVEFLRVFNSNYLLESLIFVVLVNQTDVCSID